MVIRRPLPSEFAEIDRLRTATIDEVYRGLWTTSPIPVEKGDWNEASIAVVGKDIAGVSLTSNDWLDDLWIARRYRGQGLGAELLALAEHEIAQRGWVTGRLRVVLANQRAIGFYTSHGWQPLRSYRHEVLPVDMLELHKKLRSTEMGSAQG